MISLGIESTAHTFGIGIIDDKGNILADERSSFKDAKGMVPHEVAEHHEKAKKEILDNALKNSGIAPEKIDLISYSRGPGLPPPLLVGMNLAKELSSMWNEPLLGVNHCAAHLTIGDILLPVQDPLYLYVSGVNTQLIAAEGGRYRVIGETVDIGLGNALDKFGRHAKLPFPAGPRIEELARKGKFIKLPYIVKGMDTSFSGVLTKAVQLLDKGIPLNDLAYSFQETAFSMLAEIAERGLAHTGKKELILVGGVGANKRFCSILNTMCEERNAIFYNLPSKYAGDQGVMIAWQGLLEHKFCHKTDTEGRDIDPRWRIEDVDICWSHKR